MAGLQDALLNNFANELCQEAEGQEVWAFIATYDERGAFAWKAVAETEDGETIVLGSEKLSFDSLKGIEATLPFS